MCLTVKKSFRNSKPPDTKVAYKIFKLFQNEKGEDVLVPPYNSFVIKGKRLEYKVLDAIVAYNYYYSINNKTIYTKSSKRSFLRENKEIFNKLDLDNGIVYGGAIHCFKTIEAALNSSLFHRVSCDLVLTKVLVDPNDWIAENDQESAYLKVIVANIICKNYRNEE